MADPIVIPKGTLAAIKSGQPLPAAEAKPSAAPAPEAKPDAKKVPTNRQENAKPEAKAEAKPAAEPPKDATPAEKKIWKLKAAGKEIDFDATDEESVKKHLEKALGADDVFKSASQLRRQAETFFEMLKTPDGAKKVLSDPRFGIDLKQMAKDIVWEEIQQQQREEEWKKDPGKKTAWENEQKLKNYEASEAKAKAEAAERQKSEDAQRWAGEYEQKITKALELGGIPKTEGSVDRMVQLLTTSIDQGLDLTPEEIVQQVRQDYLSDLASVLSGATGEQLLEFLGEAGAKKVREADLKRLKRPDADPFPKRAGNREAAKKPAEARPKRLAGSEWRAALEKGFLNRSK